jgi:putative peptidoglycan lipid II flippase
MASMNLLRALATVSGMTLLSRILGFVRDFVVARAFGAGVETDAFFVAFRLPNLLRRMFAEGPSPRPSCRSWPNTKTSAARRRPTGW